jgi:hypothetical protein
LTPQNAVNALTQQRRPCFVLVFAVASLVVIPAGNLLFDLPLPLSLMSTAAKKPALAYLTQLL